MKTDQYHHGRLKQALIEAGIEILAHEDVKHFSLRQVAKRAGVSHSAPYAHFADKQALIAAIATEGHKYMHAIITEIIDQYPEDPLRQLVEASYAYLDFGLEKSDLFKITYGGAVENEHDHPDLVEMAQKSFTAIRELVARCQQAGIFPTGDDRLIASNVWGSIYGLVTLLQQGQVSSAILSNYSPRAMALFNLDLMTLVDIDPGKFLSEADEKQESAL